MFVYRLLVSGLFLFQFNFALAAQQIHVQLGFGRVHLSSVNDSVSPQWSKLLSEAETQLLVDEDLGPIVTGNNLVEFDISTGDEVISSEDSVQNLVKSIKGVGLQYLPPPEESPLIMKEGRRRVVMGSHLDVEEGEYLEEVVVVAGSADIRGKVDRLVVIGGEVHLFATAEIVEELNTIGGYVQTDVGARVNGRAVRVGVPLSDQSWNMIFNRLRATEIGKWLTSDFTLFMFALFKILSLMVFAVVGYYVAPKYQQKTFDYLSENSVKCLVWGFISVALVLPVTMFLALSVVGIPLMPLQFSLYFLFFIFGYVQGAHFVASLIERKVEALSSKHVFLKIFLGLLIFEVLNQVPYLGGWIKWLVIFAGFGAASRIFYLQILTPPGKRHG